MNDELAKTKCEEKWRVFRINDCDWWLARTLEEAVSTAVAEYGGDADLVEEPRELTDAELDRLQFVLGDGDEWECDCGRKLHYGDGRACQGDVRWNGRAWEHSHPYPAGHVEMRHTIPFREELRRRVAAGPKVELFASTEF